ncbi:MAG: hypothetical protein WCI18_09395 [Pseudomonadota bacterium]
MSEVMLQQTVIAAVIPKYIAFMKRFPSAEAFAEADEESIRPYVSGLGYYRRFALLQKGALQVTQEGYPQSRTKWQDIAGVGPYTSAAIASITLNEAVGVVDGNVERVLARIFNIQEVVSTPQWKSIFFSFMSRLTELGEPGDLNQSVMELGQTVCRISSPRCSECPISKHCLAHKLQTQSQCPGPKAPKEFLKLSLLATLHTDGDNIFLVKRSEDSLLLKGTIGFPIKETQKKSLPLKHSVKHNITKYKITATFLHSLEAPQGEGIWVKRKNMETFLLASLDQKIWRIAQKNIFAEH